MTDRNARPDDDTLIRGLLVAAGITPGEEEIRALVAKQAGRRESLARLYAISESRYEDMHLIPARDFDVVPPE